MADDLSLLALVSADPATLLLPELKVVRDHLRLEVAELSERFNTVCREYNERASQVAEQQAAAFAALTPEQRSEIAGRIPRAKADVQAVLHEIAAEYGISCANAWSLAPRKSLRK